MKVIKPLRLGVLYRVVEHRRQLVLSVGVLACFPFASPADLLGEAGMWKLVAAELGGAPLDAGMPKAMREVLVTGSAFAPGKTPCPACRVRVQVGPIDKALDVFGDRHWLVGAPSDPAPFLEMPVTYQNAFGGQGYNLNPIGKGFTPPEERGAPHPLPNIEDPRSPIRAPGDRPPPAGFGPYDPMWPQRQAAAGTYDERWLEEVYPGYPDDMDLSAFNTAPEDQRTAEALRGDEAIRIENMHPDKAVLETTLPALAARCFVTQKGAAGEAFVEIPMAVETVHLFPHAERGVVIFRGTLPVTDEDAADILHLIAAAEHLGSPRPAEHYRAVLAQRLDRARAHLFALRDRDLLPEQDGPSSPAASAEVDEMRRLLAREGLLERNARRRAERELEKARENLREQGFDPDRHLPAELPPPEPAPDLDNLAEYMEKVGKETEQKKAEAEAARRKAEEDARRICEEQGLDYDLIQDEQRRKAGGPPKFSAKARMEHLQEVLEMARNAGVDVPHVEAQLADPALRAKLEAVEKRLLEVYIRFAHEMPPAMPAGEEDRARMKQEILADHASGRGLRGRDLTGMSLSGLDLSGADLRDALLEAADLSGVDLRNADLEGAVLARADLTRANLKGARLRKANLGRARLVQTRAEAADFSRATLHGADFTGADLTGADLTGADLSEATFRGTSFVDVKAPETSFLESDLTEVDLSGADLTKCNFIEVLATGTSFAGATLTSAVLLGVKATGAVFRGASLGNLRVVRGSVMDEADFSGARLAGATMRGTRLAGSDFTEAHLDGADLSECDLRGAKLARATAREARFVKADLAGADFSDANLMGSLLQRANLRGTSLRGVNLFRADLLRATVDGDTQMEGAETEDVRFTGVRRSHAEG